MKFKVNIIYQFEFERPCTLYFTEPILVKDIRKIVQNNVPEIPFVGDIFLWHKVPFDICTGWYEIPEENKMTEDYTGELNLVITPLLDNFVIKEDLEVEICFKHHFHTAELYTGGIGVSVGLPKKNMSIKELKDYISINDYSSKINLLPRYEDSHIIDSQKMYVFDNYKGFGWLNN